MASESMTQQSCTLLIVKAYVKTFKIPRISSAKTILLVARNPAKFPSNVEELSVSFLFRFA
jgi:hypothetical protein